jgi:hypothetical protein
MTNAETNLDRSFEAAADLIVELGLTESCGPYLLAMWDRAENGSCYFGPSNASFPWFQTYGFGQNADAYQAVQS